MYTQLFLNFIPTKLLVKIQTEWISNTAALSPRV